MDIYKLSIFVTSAEAGSLSAASHRLGVQLSTISRQVSDLEAELGAQLLLRTGRGVKLTQAGERFIERARVILREMDAAAAEARGGFSSLGSTLRVTTPVELALQLLPAVIAEFTHANPGVGLDVHSDARRVSLLEEDFDAAIRLGGLQDSNYKARKVGEVRLILCAGPGAAARIRTIADLKNLSFVRVAGLPSEVPVAFQGEQHTLVLEGPVTVSTFTEAAEISAQTSLGVMLPTYTALGHIGRGSLCTLAASLQLKPTDVTLLTTKGSRHASALRTLGDSLQEHLRRHDNLAFSQC